MGKSIAVTCIMILTLFTGNILAAFSDDFSEEAASNLLWISGSDGVTLQFANKTCIVTNSNATYSGIAPHTLAANEKSSVFTLSGKITLNDASMSAGFVCCLSIGTTAAGYFIAIKGDGIVTVTKISSSGAGEVVVNARSAYMTSGANELKVSKRDDHFNICCNGHFVTTFIDDDFATGDIALLVASKTTAVFDDIVLTDVFTECAPPTCFADDFNDGDLVGWSSFGDEGASVRNDANALRITTAKDQNCYEVIDLPLQQFVVRTTVSYHGGNIQKLYGLFICGTPSSSGGTIPLAGFGIIGARQYGVFTAGQNLTLTPSTLIKGAPYVSSTGDTTFYKNTLEVVKRNGSTEYLFIINADTLTRFSGVNFTVTGAGLFCLDSIDVVFDDFIVAEGTNGICPVRPLTPSIVRGEHRGVPGNGDMRLFDLSGRLIAREMSASSTAAAAGIYLRRDAVRPVYRITDR